MMRATMLAASLTLAVFSTGAQAQSAAGANEYAWACSSCHGLLADGDGPLAEYMSVEVPALTGLAAALELRRYRRERYRQLFDPAIADELDHLVDDFLALDQAAADPGNVHQVDHIEPGQVTDPLLVLRELAGRVNAANQSADRTTGDRGYPVPPLFKHMDDADVREAPRSSATEYQRDCRLSICHCHSLLWRPWLLGKKIAGRCPAILNQLRPLTLPRSGERTAALFVRDDLLVCLPRQHDDCHRRSIAWTRSRLQDAQVAARALLEARPDLGKQLAYRFLVTQPIESQPTIRDAVFFSERNQRLNDPTQLFCLR